MGKKRVLRRPRRRTQGQGRIDAFVRPGATPAGPSSPTPAETPAAKASRKRRRLPKASEVHAAFAQSFGHVAADGSARKQKKEIRQATSALLGVVQAAVQAPLRMEDWESDADFLRKASEEEVHRFPNEMELEAKAVHDQLMQRKRNPSIPFDSAAGGGAMDQGPWRGGWQDAAPAGGALPEDSAASGHADENGGGEDGGGAGGGRDENGSRPREGGASPASVATDDLFDVDTDEGADAILEGYWEEPVPGGAVGGAAGGAGDDDDTDSDATRGGPAAGGVGSRPAERGAGPGASTGPAPWGRAVASGGERRDSRREIEAMLLDDDDDDGDDGDGGGGGDDDAEEEGGDGGCGDRSGGVGAEAACDSGTGAGVAEAGNDRIGGEGERGGFSAAARAMGGGLGPPAALGSVGAGGADGVWQWDRRAEADGESASQRSEALVPTEFRRGSPARTETETQQQQCRPDAARRSGPAEVGTADVAPAARGGDDGDDEDDEDFEASPGHRLRAAGAGGSGSGSGSTGAAPRRTRGRLSLGARGGSASASNAEEPARETWGCPVCTRANVAAAESCDRCSTLRADAGCWLCPSCTLHNAQDSDRCAVCQADRSQTGGGLSLPAGGEGEAAPEREPCGRPERGSVAKSCTPDPGGAGRASGAAEGAERVGSGGEVIVLDEEEDEEDEEEDEEEAYEYEGDEGGGGGGGGGGGEVEVEDSDEDCAEVLTITSNAAVWGTMASLQGAYDSGDDIEEVWQDQGTGGRTPATAEQMRKHLPHFRPAEECGGPIRYQEWFGAASRGARVRISSGMREAGRRAMEEARAGATFKSAVSKATIKRRVAGINGPAEEGRGVGFGASQSELGVWLAVPPSLRRKSLLAAARGRKSSQGGHSRRKRSRKGGKRGRGSQT